MTRKNDGVMFAKALNKAVMNRLIAEENAAKEAEKAQMKAEQEIVVQALADHMAKFVEKKVTFEVEKGDFFRRLTRYTTAKMPMHIYVQFEGEPCESTIEWLDKMRWILYKNEETGKHFIKPNYDKRTIWEKLLEWIAKFLENLKNKKVNEEVSEEAEEFAEE